MAAILREENPGFEGNLEVYRGDTLCFIPVPLKTAFLPGEQPQHLRKDAMKYHGRKTLSKDEKGVVELPLNGERGNPRRNLVSESGLYKLITRSDKPEAKPFQEWVTRDVLPSIRKTGSYSLTDGEDTTPAATGEIVQHSGAETVEAEFKALVSSRFNRRTQQIAALKAELHELEIAQDKDGNLLSLLAA